MKKFLLLMFGVLMAFQNIAAYDFTYEYEGQTLTYTVIDEDARTCKTKDGKSWFPGNNVIEESLVIPSVAKDGDIEYAVTELGYRAFYDCSSLTSVNIPESVIKIGDSAFSRCSSLTSVNIPESVTKIGNDAFCACNNLTSVNIPESVTELGDRAFSDCSSLTSVNIPESVIKIGDSAFSGCSSLTSVNIPESVTELGDQAFSDCSSLTSVNIPESVTEIGYRAFSGCSSLTSVNIPESVIKIGDSAFSGCSSLTSVNIPESVIKIGNNAFCACNNLTSVNIPESVTELGDYAFSDCSSLTSVYIPEAVTEIGTWTFSDCSSLTSVYIPESVTKIGFEAFYMCESLSSIVFLPRDCELGMDAFLTDSNIIKVAAYDSSLFASDGVFSSASIKWVIEDDVTFDAEKGILWSAGNTQCFVMTDYTGSVIMPDGMTQLNSIPFSYCENLTDVQLPGTLETIGSQVFKNTAVKEVVIPNRVSKVDKDAFQNTDLVKGAFPDVIESPFDRRTVLAVGYDAVDSKITDNFVYSRRGDKLHYAPFSITPEFEVPETVTEITDMAFYKCEALTKITLPEKLSTLGESVWEDCLNITTVVCNNPEPVEAGRDVFHVNIYKDATLFVPKGSKEKYESTMPWSYFYNITEVESGINGVMTDDADAIDDTLPVKVYNLQGVMVAESMENLPAGIYIVRQGKNVKKIAVK